MSSATSTDGFDQVLEKVGYREKFQFRFDILFNLIFVILISMSYLNIILALAVPDHWCHVPGRESTNYTIDEWKELTLPKEYDIKGKEATSKCKMYNTSFDISSREFNDSIIACQYGWDFDRTWYEEMAPSQGDWVCEKELFVSNAFAFGRIGEIVGTFIFGQLGDYLGRRPVFFLTLITLIIGRTLSAFTADNYSLFLFAMVVGSIPSRAVFQSPLIVAMEITEESRRTHIAMLQCMGWTIGISFMPFILWACGHWFQFLLMTTLPCVLFLFSARISGSLISYVLVLNVTPFMTFFWQGIVELPAYIVAKYTCDRIGRRWNQVLFYLIGAFGCITMAILITYPGMEKVIIGLSSFLKICVAFVFYVTNLQKLEIFPTCVRQSGLSLCIISASVCSIFGPYIVYLGTSYNASYTPIAMAILAFTGAIAASFLPETLHEKLPETLADAQEFGANQEFWSWPRKKVETAESI